MNCRFNFGPKDAEGNREGATTSGSYMQLLSTTDPNDAWTDYQLSIVTDQLLSSAGHFIDPGYLPTFFPLEFGTGKATEPSDTAY